MDLAGNAPSTIIGRLRAIQAAQAKFETCFAMARGHSRLGSEKTCKDKVDEQRIGRGKADNATHNAQRSFAENAHGTLSAGSVARKNAT